MLTLLSVTSCAASASGPGPGVATPPKVSAAASNRHAASASPEGASARHCPTFSKQTITISDHGAPHGRRYAQIITPYTKGSATNLPVLYFLHGFPGGGDNVGNGPTSKVFERQMCQGAAPFILVAPDGNSATHADTEWANAADGRFDVESFVTGPLIAAVEGRHRRPAALRAVAGFSMGGYGAADLALRHPDLYRQFVSIAGYFTVDDPDGAFGRSPDQARIADRNAHTPLLLTSKARGMRVLLIDSTGDTDRLDLDQDQRFSPLLKDNGAVVESVTSDLPHTYALVEGEVPAIVRFLEFGWKGGRG